MILILGITGGELDTHSTYPSRSVCVSLRPRAKTDTPAPHTCSRRHALLAYVVASNICGGDLVLLAKRNTASTAVRSGTACPTQCFGAHPTLELINACGGNVLLFAILTLDLPPGVEDAAPAHDLRVPVAQMFGCIVIARMVSHLLDNNLAGDVRDALATQRHGRNGGAKTQGRFKVLIRIIVGAVKRKSWTWLGHIGNA